MKWLQKLMFWRKREEPKTPPSLPDSGPNDPRAFAPQTPAAKRDSEALHRETLFGEERKAEEGEPPDYTH
jgi:hypothetical protein